MTCSRGCIIMYPILSFHHQNVCFTDGSNRMLAELNVECRAMAGGSICGFLERLPSSDTRWFGRGKNGGRMGGSIWIGLKVQQGGEGKEGGSIIFANILCYFLSPFQSLSHVSSEVAGAEPKWLIGELRFSLGYRSKCLAELSIGLGCLWLKPICFPPCPWCALLHLLYIHKTIYVSRLPL